MSGIAGIVNLDGEPIDGRLLDRMGARLLSQGSDGTCTWRRRNVGFASALLDTPGVRETARPLTVGGQTWILADARLDERGRLAEVLGESAGMQLGEAPDAELILRAYRQWGSACLDRLIGDFAFAIWDECNHVLFCGRDHFGVKPLYYFHLGRCFGFSNSLACLRTHPSVSSRLNDSAVGDLLLFDINRDTSTTFFADVRKLAPAHFLTVAGGRCAVRRYWQLPIDDEIRLPNSGDAERRLAELLRQAVRDRMPASGAAVSMSGGLDSTSIAAMAGRVVREERRNSEVRTFTIAYQELLPDEEPYFAALVAEALGLRIHYLNADSYGLYDLAGHSDLPEPHNEPLRGIFLGHLAQIAAFGRVALCGHGGDPLFAVPDHSLLGMTRKVGVVELPAAIWKELQVHRRLPALGLASGIRRRFSPSAPLAAQYPPWLNPGFASEYHLSERWQEQSVAAPPVHPRYPLAYAELTDPMWPHTFETQHPGNTGIPVEIRYPFFDLRLVRFVLALPFRFWRRDKGMLRQAMIGILPEVIRRRLKAPLGGDPIAVRLKNRANVDRSFRDLAPFVRRYVNPGRVPTLEELRKSPTPAIGLRPWSLNHWALASARRPEQSVATYSTHC